MDPAAALPVRLRLPDGQGWVVAAKGARLDYRTGEAREGDFADAALIPDAATQVQIRHPGRCHECGFRDAKRLESHSVSGLVWPLVVGG
ncbi:hypothetical protein [Amycolatopsis albispora]|uniref:hypothetical protein n=1 Tax=Amycolatopsis albispora TaxID=1804986 RepID=UPI0013B451C3|nr:hypothetical protein [Amycolatopsis albispora]